MYFCYIQNNLPKLPKISQCKRQRILFLLQNKLSDYLGAEGRWIGTVLCILCIPLMVDIITKYCVSFSISRKWIHLFNKHWAVPTPASRDQRQTFGEVLLSHTLGILRQFNVHQRGSLPTFGATLMSLWWQEICLQRAPTPYVLYMAHDNSPPFNVAHASQKVGHSQSTFSKTLVQDQPHNLWNPQQNENLERRGLA